MMKAGRMLPILSARGRAFVASSSSTATTTTAVADASARRSLSRCCAATTMTRTTSTCQPATTTTTTTTTAGNDAAFTTAAGPDRGFRTATTKSAWRNGVATIRSMSTVAATTGRSPVGGGGWSGSYGIANAMFNDAAITSLSPSSSWSSSSRRRHKARFFSSYPPHEVVGLPSLSPTMESGSISSWILKEGDSFSAGDVFCSVETDKATVDFEAQDDGVLAKILVGAGSSSEELKVGDPIMIITEDADHVPAFADYKVSHDQHDDGGGGAASPAPPATTETPAPAPPPPPPPPPAPQAAAITPTTTAATAGGRVFASPLAQTLAKEMGYDLSTVSGTGPKGRVVAADVRELVPAAAADGATAAVPSPQPTTTTPRDLVVPDGSSGDVVAPARAAMTTASPTPATPAPVAGAGYTDYVLSDSAREAAERLVRSKRNVPHYYLTVDIAMDEVLRLRSDLNDRDDGGDGSSSSIGVYEIVIKAAAASMRAVPSVNASWMDTAVRVYDSVDVNVVLGSGDDLRTPVIADVAGKGLGRISDELRRHAAVDVDTDGEVVASASSPDDDAVGTFTVMNLGMYGIKSCAPIIREPQSCALAVGALEERIVPNDDYDGGSGGSSTSESDDEDGDANVCYKHSVVMTATLSCDHRVVDGAVGAQWLAAFKSHLENPVTLLL